MKEWIAGRRDPEGTVAAWDAAVNLPARVFREDVARACIAVGATATAVGAPARLRS